MSSSLGLYIEKNMIKYAKVSKDRQNIKIDSYGVKFYEDIDEAINQIVEETYSYKTPISINLKEEIYNYFNMFALLSKKDLDRAIKVEFETYCSDKGYNPNVFETRYAVVNELDDKDKMRVIHIAENKIELTNIMQKIEGYKLTTITPISMSIANLIETNPKENYLIVNIEDETTITTIMDDKIYGVTKLEQGASEILNKLNIKENSYSKSYEICKNTTIYTAEGKELQDIESSHLEDIMPTLYEIAGQVRKIVNDSLGKIQKVYITGTGAVVNNIDLYFQEYLSEIECKILKPYFVQPTKGINIKDYIEVNSAISLALVGVGEGIQGINFKSLSTIEKIPDWAKIEVNPVKARKTKKTIRSFFINDLGQRLDKTEMSMIRTAIGLVILLSVYTGFSVMLSNQMDKKEQEAKTSISTTNNQISLAETDNTKVETKTNEYATMIENLKEINERITDINRNKNAIPNLLNAIMYNIPEGVQVTSIQNTKDRHIEINAQSDKYEQLGMFKAIIQTDPILINVVSTAGQNQNGVVTVKIEGDLP